MDESWWKVNLDDEYERNAKLRREDVAAIRNWLKKQPHIPALTDHHIIMFLAACNYSLKSTKDTMDLNLTLRTRIPEFFTQRDPIGASILETMKCADMALVPSRDGNNNIHIIYKLRQIDLAKYNFENLTKLGFMTQDLSHLEMGSAPGYIFIEDMANVTVAHLFKSPISSVSQCMKYAQEASSCAIKAIHVVNGGTLFEKIMSFIKPFLHPDVAKMICVHNSYESLRSSVPPSCLPKDYGGDLPSLEELHNETMEKLKTYRDWFREEEALRIDEKKRSSDKNADVQSSFRRLELD